MSKSLLLLVDGYNVIGPVAGPSGNPDPDWLSRERISLLDRLAAKLPSEVRGRTCVVFDAANPPRDRPHRFAHQDMDVRFAVGYPEADDLLEEIISAHHSPKRLSVVSSDHRVQTAISRRGGRWFDSDPWFDRLLDGRLELAFKPKSHARGTRSGAAAQERDADVPDSAGLPPEEVRDWLRDFGLEDPQ